MSPAFSIISLIVSNFSLALRANTRKYYVGAYFHLLSGEFIKAVDPDRTSYRSSNICFFALPLARATADCHRRAMILVFHGQSVLSSSQAIRCSRHKQT